MLDSRWSARMPPNWPVPSANINNALLILAPQSIRFAWLAFAATRVSRLAAKLVHFASIVAGASAQEHGHQRDRSVIGGATVRPEARRGGNRVCRTGRSRGAADTLTKK